MNLEKARLRKAIAKNDRRVKAAKPESYVDEWSKKRDVLAQRLAELEGAR